MNQPIELQSLRDLSQYQVYENFERRKLYLYVFKKSGYVNVIDRDTGRRILFHVDAGTIHIGKPITTKIKNRDNVLYELPALNEKLGWKFYRSDQEMYWGFDPHVKQDIGDSVVSEYALYYELIPGATRFEDKRPLGMSVSPILFEEVSVFDIGDIGYELALITPEQAAEKYFGVSDFRQFFSNYAAVNKQMSLKNHPHVSREYEHADDLRSQVGLPRIAPKGIPLTGMHPVKPLSSFHEYVHAGKQLFTGKHQVNPDVSPSKPASLLSGAASGLMLGYGRPFSAIATFTLPILGNIHSRIREQQELNAQQQKKTVALSGEEREKLLAKGAMASELTRRLTTDPTQSRTSFFKSIHNRVHQKPTHPRIHWSNTKRGGRKNRRTIKKNI